MISGNAKSYNLEQIKRDYRQGIPLRAAEALGLFSEKQPSELQN